jgi:outer membrane receptor for ferrienterochelin and colicin
LEAVTVINRYFSVVANFSQFTMTFDWDPATASAAELNYIENIGDHYLTNAPATRANLGFDFTFWKLKSFVGLNYGGKSEGNRRFALEGLRSVQIPQYLQENFWVAYEFNPRFHIQLAADNIGAKKSDPEESTNIFMLGSNGMVQPEATYLLSANYRF